MRLGVIVMDVVTVLEGVFVPVRVSVPDRVLVGVCVIVTV